MSQLAEQIVGEGNYARKLISGSFDPLRQARYVKHPNQCPFCRSEILDAEPLEVGEDGFPITVVTCEGCKRRWQENYTPPKRGVSTKCTCGSKRITSEALIPGEGVWGGGPVDQVQVRHTCKNCDYIWNDTFKLAGFTEIKS